MKSFSAKSREPQTNTPEPAEEENRENEDIVASPTPTKLEKPSMKILREIQQKQLELIASKKRPIEDDDSDVIPMTPDEKAPLSQRIEEFATQEDMLDDDFDMTGIEEFDSCAETETGLENAKSEVVTEEQLLEGWSTMQAGTSNESNIDVKVDISQLPTVTNDEGKKVRIYFSVPI